MTRRSASTFLSDRVQADGVDKNVWVEFVGMAMKHQGFFTVIENVHTNIEKHSTWANSTL